MLRKIGLHTGLILACLSILLPVLWILRTSLVPESQAYSSTIFPQLSWENFRSLIENNGFLRHYANSLIVATGSVILALPFAAATGYAFARFKTGGKAARFIMLATQMLPAVALVLPAFAMLRAVGLTNSLMGLTLVYAALNLPFLTWILMGFFEGITVDLEWAAMTDGATAWGAFWHVVLPVLLPGLAASAVLGFILSWNEFLFALVLSGPDTATVPVVLAVLPLMIASHFIQRYIVKGLTFGGVK